nr:hypothetical protein [Tanacetum cinerariifolium]
MEIFHIGNSLGCLGPGWGCDRVNVERLCVHLIRLCEMMEEVLVRSGLSSIWSNKECDLVFKRNDDNSEMSIYDFMTFPSWGDAKVVEEIKLTLFPLNPSPYHMSYPYEGVSSHLYTKEKRTESLLPLELSNCINVLSALLDKLDQKTGYVKENIELRSRRDVAYEEVKKLQSQLADARVASSGLTEELARTDAKLSEPVLTMRDLHDEFALESSKPQGYKDVADELRIKVIQFIGSGVGLRMGRNDADFKAAAQKVSNFHIGAEADFNKALVAFPTTPFPFLGKVVAAAGGSLSEVPKSCRISWLVWLPRLLLLHLLLMKLRTKCPLILPLMTKLLVFNLLFMYLGFNQLYECVSIMKNGDSLVVIALFDGALFAPFRAL